MKIGVPKENAEGERRVALIPDVVASLSARSSRSSSRRAPARAPAIPTPSTRRPGPRSAIPGAPRSSPRSRCRAPRRSARLSQGQILIGHLAPLTSAETNKALASAGVTSFAMEAIPRITRAQAMDALSSQANVAGYAAALLAAREAGRFFPMMTTAAGTVAPAKVLVLGAGVAGPAGDRHGQAPGRRRHRLRHPPRRLGADRLARRPPARARLHPRRRGRGRLRPAPDRGGERAGPRGAGRERGQART